MDLSELKEDIMEVFEKHETRTGGKGLATDLAFLTVKDVASKKSKGEKTFFELDKKEQKKQLNSVGKVLGNAPKRSLDAAKKASKKLMGKGINESENANQKRNSRLVKGSKEAMEWGKKMREARESKSGQ